MMDYEKIKAGVQLMLEGIGEDVTREGLLEGRQNDWKQSESVSKEKSQTITISVIVCMHIGILSSLTL